MTDIVDIGPQLVGRKVQCATRPDWGTGEVLLVKRESTNGHAVHRVSIQFAAGHKTLLIPPGRLVEPQEQYAAAAPPPAGWLDQIRGATPEDGLRKLPESVTQLLGSIEQRVRAVAELYADDAAIRNGDAHDILLRWARRQSGEGDPLQRWSRDELVAAWTEFCQKRDAYLRGLLNEVRRKRGPTGIVTLLADIGPEMAARIRRFA